MLAVFLSGSGYAESDSAQPPLFAGGLIGLMVLVAAVASSTLRDDDGYLMSPSVSVTSSGSAVVSQTMELRRGSSMALAGPGG